jgi:hypothetical protein
MSNAPRFDALLLHCIEAPLLAVVKSLRVHYRAPALGAVYRHALGVIAMKPALKRKPGGQPKPPSQRKRNNLTIRVLDGLRKRLEEAAQKSKRSVSEEAAHRMMLSFNLGDELMDSTKIREANDEALADLAKKRGWAEIIDIRYGGPIYIPPGQVASKINEIIERARLGAPTTHHVVEKTGAPAVLSPALEAALQRTVEKAVAAALARATLRIGESGGSQDPQK